MTNLSEIKISAVTPSDQEAELYAAYGENKLFLCKADSLSATEIAALPNIQAIAHGIGDGRLEDKEIEISIYYHHPYICVAERFGVNAALVNLQTRAVRALQREDYHCDVSSYSIGFLERDGRTLLICQTQWNRLDILDAETGENLTEREVYCRDTGRKQENGNPLFEYKNYLDYFHSLLLVAPDGKHFLSNGWVWQPFDRILIFQTDKFFTSFEVECIVANTYPSGYNWDRPYTFIDNNVFAVAVDDARKADELDEDEKKTYEYKQLVFFNLTDKYQESAYGYRWIEPYKQVFCTVFPTNNYGEVKGKLYYDEVSGNLVALTPSGAYAINLNGEILAHLPEIVFTDVQSHGDFGSQYGQQIGWDYSPKHHVFYTWQSGIGVVEQKLD